MLISPSNRNFIHSQKINNEKKKETLRGVLVNSHIKNQQDSISFDDVKNSLLIYESQDNFKNQELISKENDKNSFDVISALKPVIAATGVLAAGSFLLSAILKKSSKALINSKSFEQLPDLAVNMNIKEEPQFAIYRAIRDPNFKNVLGAAAIFLMSGITLAAKNFTDGAKEIWVKKQNADIERDLQEKLIEVEKNSFFGKINIINALLEKNVEYFDSVLNKTPKNPAFEKNNKEISFKANNKNKEENKTKNIKFALLSASILALSGLLAKMSISNLQKTAQNTNKFANGFCENVIEKIEKMGNIKTQTDINEMTELMKIICAKPEFIRQIGKKHSLDEKTVKKIIEQTQESKKTIFADAPTALGGIPKKIQYYCYIDENRGHLYNWVLNPENKFTKYIFLAFTLSSAIGYVFKQSMDAIKEKTVLKQNAKTELDLRKRLVEVEIANFKAKKESAINPLMDNFKKQLNEGKKSPEELKILADNILNEIKNGPPYVYT